MRKKYFIIWVTSIVFISCNSENSHHPISLPQKEIVNQHQTIKLSLSNDFLGTWISLRPNSFQIVEILDSSNATISRFEKWQTSSGKKLGYYKSKGELSVTYGCNIAIRTNRFKFTYFLVKDTLFEMAEPGRVDTLLKVYNGSILQKE